MPTLIFIFAALLTLWLWDRQSNIGNGVGTVEALRVDVPAGVDGLVQVPVRPWNRFDRVQENETVAVITNFDDSLPAAKLKTIQARIRQVGFDMAAERARLQMDIQLKAANSDVDRYRQADQVDWRIERLRLQILDQQTELAANIQEYNRLNVRYEYLSRVGGAVSEQEKIENMYSRNAIKAGIEKARVALQERKAQLKIELDRKKKRQDANSGLETEFERATQEILAPFRKQIDVLEAQKDEVQTEFNTLEVKAPISGEITMVHAHPGQAVQAGDPVITIAQDSGRYIVSYVRSDQRIRVEPNMEVRVREKRNGARPVRSVISDVGPQVEPVPLQHLRDPTKAEWGLPITIELPPDLDVRPGELIDIIFSSRMARNN